MLFGFSLVSQELSEVSPAANQLTDYLHLLQNKKIAIVGNHNSLVKSGQRHVHLVDTLHQRGIVIKKVFGPEHGFRGKAPDGEKIQHQIDSITGIPIVSLYGSSRKPTAEQLADIDLLLFDLQSVGVRFYTYLSTLHLVLEACGENQIPVIILDRPNPNGYYVDGPVLDLAYRSFVGMHPIPIVYGMTLGEMAQMILGEGWLDTTTPPPLQIIPVKNYRHQRNLTIPLPPSPNLPNAQAIALYPSLCLLEPTVVSVGRGTNLQFQIYGHPDFQSDFSFVPQPNSASKYPKLAGKKCFGINLKNESPPEQIRLRYLLDAYEKVIQKDLFFLKTFERIVGNAQLREQIKAGLSEREIRASWEPQLSAFKKKRQKYLRYPDE